MVRLIKELQMFDSVKKKIIGLDQCDDNLINKTFIKLQNKVFESHNIDINKFFELVETIEFENPQTFIMYNHDTYGELHIMLNNGTEIRTNGMFLYFYIKEGSEVKRTEIESYNYVHNLMNDGIVEKYYESKWLNTSNKNRFVDLIENRTVRCEDFPHLMMMSTDIVNLNISLLKYIDETIEEVIEKFNLNKEQCKNKWILTNKDSIVNSRKKTKVVLKRKDQSSISIVFNYDEENEQYESVMY